MKTKQTGPQNIDEYIAGFPRDVREILEKIRTMIKKTAPAAEETISYKIPTFMLRGHYLIYFAAYRNHISLYPIPLGDDAFNEELSPYKAGKGTLRFPLDKPIPFGLIKKIVKFSIKRNLAQATAKGKEE